MKVKLIIILAAILSGSLILTAGLGWNSIILPEMMSNMDSSGRSFSLGDGRDSAFMEGRIGSMRLIWDAMTGKESLPSGQIPSLEMFETVWKDVEITSKGIIDTSTGEILFENFNTSFDQGSGATFPVGGVERKDYEIFNSGLNDITTVEFKGTTEVLGRTGYLFKTNITDVESSSPSNLGGFSSMEGETLPFLDDLTILFSDQTEYVLDPRTSIPYDLRLMISSSFIFPDSTLLTVLEEQVQYSEESIWIPSDSVPGRMEETNVIKETSTKGRIDPEDEMVALYEQSVTYYYKSSGEPLPEDLQGRTESFAVDRENYQYMRGFRNTQRSGYYQFPVGNPKKMDYQMWDEYLGMENTAEFSEETSVNGRNAYLYRMYTYNVEVEGGNAIIPIYRHPGTTYYMDTIQEWYIDSITGFMLDFKMDGTIRVTSAGPLEIIDQSVGSFKVDLPDNTTSELLKIAELFENLLLPLSNKPVEAFALDLGFTEDLQRDLIKISDDVVFYLDLFQNKIPLALGIVGIVIISIPVVFLIVRSVKKRRNQEIA